MFSIGCKDTDTLKSLHVTVNLWLVLISLFRRQVVIGGSNVDFIATAEKIIVSYPRYVIQDNILCNNTLFYIVQKIGQAFLEFSFQLGEKVE